MSVYAQDNEIDCDSNLNKALAYLKTSNYTKQDSIKAVNLLKPCVKQEHPYAQLLMGRLFLESNNENHFKKGFKLIKKAAKQDLAIAASDLADLYKYGIGCELDYAKTKKWYKKAHKLEDPKGTYGLGYMHYKGLGGVKQSYIKAVRLFKKSDYPMAKHWLGVAYYFGYGVEKDIDKALSILERNDFENSAIMLDCMKFHLDNEQELISEIGIDNAIILNDDITPPNDFHPEQLNGNWIGSLIQLDWSSKDILQTLPITLNLSYDAQNNETHYIWSLNNSEHNGISINEDNTLQFENLTTTVSRLYFSDKKEQHVNYNFESANFALKTYKEQNYLTALLDTYAQKMSEPGSRFALVLMKDNVQTQNGKDISTETASALKEQNGFVKLYPNPFKNDLYISYILNTVGTVQVEISGLHDTSRTVLVKRQEQKAGDYTYYVDGSQLKKGTHVVSITVNGEEHTKLIIKN